MFWSSPGERFSVERKKCLFGFQRVQLVYWFCQQNTRAGLFIFCTVQGMVQRWEGGGEGYEEKGVTVVVSSPVLVSVLVPRL
jgi:hypothetical protein